MGGYDVYSFTSKGEASVVDFYLYESYDENTAAEIENFLARHPKGDIALRWFLIPRR